MIQNTTTVSAPKQKIFSIYQIFLIVLLALVQFTVFLDFMIVAPLGAHIFKALDISTAEFGLVVSAYAISAGVFGFVNAMFADKFERKKLLLILFMGIVISTFLCGIAPDYFILMFARTLAGAFGGTCSAMVQTIVGDAFELKVRGRVMGFVMLAIALTQIGGLPLGLYLATKFDWHAPFLFVGAFSLLVWLLLIWKMKPMNIHLNHRTTNNPLMTLWKILKEPKYQRAYYATLLVFVSGSLMMPYSTAFLVNNVKLTEDMLPALYLTLGICSLVMMPLVGRFSDKVGRFRMLALGIIISSCFIPVYTNMSVTPFSTVAILNVVIFTGILMRMVPFNALIIAVPELKDRGGFMSANSSLQQIGGGAAAFFGGLITYRASDGLLMNYNILGYITIAVSLLLMWLAYRVHKSVGK